MTPRRPTVRERLAALEHAHDPAGGLVEVLVLPIALVLIASILDLPSILKTMTYLPVYNLSNINSWIIDGQPLSMDLGDFMVARSLAFSFAGLFAWMFTLIGLTVYIFRRQDITS